MKKIEKIRDRSIPVDPKTLIEKMRQTAKMFVSKIRKNKRPAQSE